MYELCKQFEKHNYILVKPKYHIFCGALEKLEDEVESIDDNFKF